MKIINVERKDESKVEHIVHKDLVGKFARNFVAFSSGHPVVFDVFNEDDSFYMSLRTSTVMNITLDENNNVIIETKNTFYTLSDED